MAKKKKRKVRKFLLFIVFIVLIGFFVIRYIGDEDIQTKNKLKKIGYNDSEITTLVGKFDDEKLNVFYNKYYSDVSVLLENPDFEFDNIDIYVDYANKYSVDYNKAIIMVNAGFKDYEYNELLLSFKEDSYFKFDNTDRYLKYADKHNSLNTRDVISAVNCNLDSAYYTKTSTTNLEDGTSLIVNKYYYLASDYVPNDLVTVYSPYGSGKVVSVLYDNFKLMADEARKNNLNIYIASGYRSYDLQNGLYNMYLKTDSQASVDTYSARPGFSEHQTGLAIDLNSINSSFAYTNEYKWLKDNAHKYGFILRYTKDDTDLTGYMFEPWHYRYVGVDIATYIYEKGITYDEYYEYFVK